jgi:CRISPR/Cas system-associated endonuclease Cas3-HD
LTAVALSRRNHDELAGLGKASQIFDTTVSERPRAASCRHEYWSTAIFARSSAKISKRKERHPSEAAPSFP